ncbi:chromosome partitioning protein ParA, partial [Neorhizobium sp. P12A]|uniref:polysaccharide biosynthesis tyrosine autokinase n=1 Tax=Neorhizobium sp. P12A TaxID=2268027 RepID=UPI0011EDF52A
MLSPDKVSRTDAQWDDDARSEFIDFDKLIAVARRQWRVVAAAAVVFFVLGLIYVFTAVPQYTAVTNLLIDKDNSDVANEVSTLSVGGFTDDEGSVLSQVELIKSDTIALAVVDKLKLLDNPIFMDPSASPLSVLKRLLDFKSWFADSDAAAETAEDRREDAAAALSENMTVERVGRTYVLSISYTSPSPDLAAQIAGAIADAYLVDKLNSKYDATRRASDWLQGRIDELRQKALESDLAVQKFIATNGLVSSNGQLLSDQQLTQLNSALIDAQGQTAQAQAKYDRIESIIASGKTDAIVADVLDSPTITDLRKKYLDASKVEADISKRLGQDHEQAVRLRAEMSEYQRLMFEELGRIAESYKSELDVAKTREKSLQDSVSQATGISATAGETQVQLRELQRNADTYRTLYQTFLARFQEATQQQSFPISDSRIITRATVPDAPSKPKKPLILAASLFLGLMVGAGFGAFREFRDRFFRTGEQVRATLNLEYLGITPLLPATAADGAAAQEPAGLRHAHGVASYVVDHPLSVFAETMRSAKIAIDLDGNERRSKLIGVVSSLPGEGKSTVATNFAHLLAMQGAKTLLIDGDLRNPGATRAIGRHAEAGLLEAILEHRPLQNLLLVDPKTKLAFLPAVVKRRVPHSSELLASSSMSALLDIARAHFDYVIIDLPPLGPVVDAKAISPLLDSLLYVIEWGRTSRKVVRSTLLTEPDLVDKCAGIILNKVDTEKMKLYRTYGSSEYYYSRYTSYYHEA